MKSEGDDLESVIESHPDRRSEKREPATECIDLYLDGVFLATCRLRDQCPSGAFIETGEARITHWRHVADPFAVST